MRIALISDTHGIISEDVYEGIYTADEVWHAGDLGSLETLEQLKKFKYFRAVYGNIDNKDIRISMPRYSHFEIQGIQFLMIHIGAYPPNYNKKILDLLDAHPCQVLICGHSHILRVKRDQKRNLLYLNPGACGFKGFHKYRTYLEFEIIDGRMKNLNVHDLGARSQVNHLNGN